MIMKMRKFYSHRILISTFAGHTMPPHDQNLQKSFQVPTHREREILKNAPRFIHKTVSGNMSNHMNNIDKIRTILSTQFENDLFEASLKSLYDTSNKLRYNNFAFSIRELSRHFLKSLSPEQSILNCNWYKPETQNNKPTRRQKIKYAIQGGICDDTLRKLGFNVLNLNNTISSIIDSINTLSKFTHINPEIFDLNKDDVDKNSTKVLNTFLKFVETIEIYREKLKSFLDGHIEDHMVYSIISSYFENLDSLAPHYSLKDSEVSEYNISEINDEEIIVTVSGNLYVILEYGSRKDRREGDGLDIKESFPFETKIRYEISDDFPDVNYEVEDYDVDTSRWYK